MLKFLLQQQSPTHPTAPLSLISSSFFITKTIVIIIPVVTVILIPIITSSPW